MKEKLEIIEMALGFLRAFLYQGGEGDNSFADLYDDICDSYSAEVDAQYNEYIIQKLLNFLK